MTKYIKEEEINDVVISELGKAIQKGKLVIFPTDTVYGIGTNALDEKACEKIYDAKGRPSFKPLIVLISNETMLKKLVDQISDIERNLMNSFWPGPLTIKFKKKIGSIPDIVSAKDEYVRVILVKEGVIAKVMDASNVPVVAPSANLSGSKTGTKIKNIIKELGGKVDYILDYGDIDSDITSTIVEVQNEKIIILREGKIKKEELEKIAPIIDYN